ncbi:MAG: MgtC/SapB family protein [Dongiaceae bacterium]
MFSEHIASEFSTITILIRLGVAVLLGGIIGFEREIKGRPAGLRTNMMVSLAAASFTLLTAEFVVEAKEVGGIEIDPLRVIEAVIAGVAFLGAGAIIRGGDQVHGLTTGASLWMAGAVGVAAGAGYFKLAAIGVGFALFILILLGLFERHALKTETPPLEPQNGKKERGKRAD